MEALSAFIFGIVLGCFIIYTIIVFSSFEIKVAIACIGAFLYWFILAGSRTVYVSWIYDDQEYIFELFEL